MRATILAMRLLIAAAFAALVVVVGGCGGTASTGSTADPALGSDAAQLVPPDALAFASIDTDQSSGQSRQLDELTRAQNDRSLRLDLLKYQIDEIAAANLEAGEEESLRADRGQTRRRSL